MLHLAQDFILTIYKGPWYASFLHIFQCSSSLHTRATILPKLTINYHKFGSAQSYTPHPGKLTYNSHVEDDYPSVKVLHKFVENLLNTSFNFTSFILYIDHTGYIKEHQDSNQIEGLAQNNGKEGKEVIAILSIIGSKMLVVNDLRTNEKFHFLHKERSLYIMNG